MYDHSQNVITLSWSASCPIINQPIGYTIQAKDLVTKKVAETTILASTDSSFTHVLDKNVKLGTSYEFRVATVVDQSQWTKPVTVKTNPLPTPEAVSAFINLNGSAIEVHWGQPNLTNYLSTQKTNEKVHYK